MATAAEASKEERKATTEVTDSAAQDSLHDMATCTLTRDQYLVFLFDEMLKKGCDTKSMAQYIMMTLPGWRDDEVVHAFEAGPPLSQYGSQTEAAMFAFSRLVQYRASGPYRFVKSSKEQWPVFEAVPPYYKQPRVHRHREGELVTLSKNPILELR